MTKKEKAEIVLAIDEIMTLFNKILAFNARGLKSHEVIIEVAKASAVLICMENNINKNPQVLESRVG